MRTQNKKNAAARLAWRANEVAEGWETSMEQGSEARAEEIRAEGGSKWQEARGKRKEARCKRQKARTEGKGRRQRQRRQGLEAEEELRAGRRRCPAHLKGTSLKWRHGQERPGDGHELRAGTCGAAAANGAERLGSAVPKSKARARRERSRQRGWVDALCIQN